AQRRKRVPFPPAPRRGRGRGGRRFEVRGWGMRDGSLLAGEGRRWGRSGPGEVCVGRGGSPSWGSCCAPPAGHIVRIPTTVSRLGGAGLERVLPLADSGQCGLLCLARRKGRARGCASCVGNVAGDAVGRKGPVGNRSVRRRVRGCPVGLGPSSR